jgi:predicted PurR-regulated permease PerM
MTVMVPASRTTQCLLTVALVLLIVIGVRWIVDMIAILLVSLVLTLLALPAVEMLRRRGIPHALAVALVSLVALLFLLGLIGLLVYAVHLLVTDITVFQVELDRRIEALRVLFVSYGLDPGLISTSSFDLGKVTSVALDWMESIGDLLMTIFFVMIATFFMLLEAPQVPARIERVMGAGSPAVEQLSRMSGFVIDFMIVRTKTNLVHGLVFGGILMAMGVHAALLWGTMTFLLGYIPYLGLIAAAVPAIFFAWLQYGVPGAIAVVLVTVLLNLIVENPVFSYFASRTFEVPALLVVIAVIVFGWLLGVVGMLFAVPFLMMILILLQVNEETRWINVLLGVDRLFEERSNES